MTQADDNRIWGPMPRRRCTAALALLDDAIRGCPDEGWTARLWPVRDDDPFVWPVRHVSDPEPGEEANQRKLLEWFSAFWNVAYHALFFLDADLSSREIDSYAPPAPFAEADHEPHVVPDRPCTRTPVRPQHGNQSASKRSGAGRTRSAATGCVASEQASAAA